MWRNILLASGLSPLLFGCIQQGPTLVSLQTSCTDANPKYADAWVCIRKGISPKNPQAALYQAAGDALAEQVTAGALTDAQAKYQLAAELVRADASYREQLVQQAASEPRFCSMIGGTMICNK